MFDPRVLRLPPIVAFFSVLLLTAAAPAAGDSVIGEPGREAAVRPHAGLPCVIEVVISDRTVEFAVMAEQMTALSWGWSEEDRADAAVLRTRPVEILQKPLTSTQRDELKASIGGRILRDCRFSIDDRAVTPSVAMVRIPTEEETNFPGTPAFEFVLRVPLTERPDAVGFEWGVWERVIWNDTRRIPVQFLLEGAVPTVRAVTPEEPGYTWRYEPGSVAELEPLPPVQVIEPKPYVVPVLSLVCLFFAIALAVAGYFAVRARPVLSVAVAVLATTAFVGRSTLTVEVPVRGEEVFLPTDREAVALFGTLHQNLYLAFDARSEQEIYDRLVATVTNDLVPELYLNIRQSLVMRNEAGSICTIDEVRTTGSEVLPGTQPYLVVAEVLEGRPRFDITWSWEADGTVSHWEHQHRRTNIHTADFAVVHDGASWKIAAMETVEHEWKDRDG